MEDNFPKDNIPPEDNIPQNEDTPRYEDILQEVKDMLEAGAPYEENALQEESAPQEENVPQEESAPQEENVPQEESAPQDENVPQDTNPPAETLPLKRKRPERQSWKPHWIPNSVYKAWLAAFAMFKIALGAMATVFLICVVCGLVFAGILGGYLESDILPYSEMVKESYDLDETSYIHYVDSDGNIQELQQIYASSDREWATYDELPEDLIHAAVAIEDKRFYEHQGVDWITTIKACAGMFFGTSDAGGSTITQQLVKNITQDDSVTVRRKITEIFKAVDFERRYDKETVMEWYLNMIYFGDRKYGVKSAAAHYFGKELQELTTAECASLISITNNPSIFGPYSSTFEYDGKVMTGAERNKVRQVNTLWVMRNLGYLTEDEYQAALEDADNMTFKSGIDEQDRMAYCENQSCGYQGTVKTLNMEYRCPECSRVYEATPGEDGIIDEAKTVTCTNGDCKHKDTLKKFRFYTCPQCTQKIRVGNNASREVYSWFVDTVLEDVASLLAMQDGYLWNQMNKQEKELYLQLIQRGGYHIYTTLNMDIQEQVDAIYTNLEEIPETHGAQQLQSGIVIIDNRTGDIVAMSGGVDEKVVFDGFNMATDAQRQVGSSIKPLTVYAPAFETGEINPATVVMDLPLYYKDDDPTAPFPRNSNKKYDYSLTVVEGVMDSVNAVAINTLDKIGTRYSFDFAKYKFRLSGLYEGNANASDLNYSPLGLGGLTNGATVRDMASAYATFANGGVYREGRTFTKVYDSQGQLVLDNTQESEQILSQKSVDYVNYCLNAVVDGWNGEEGTGTVARIDGIDVCGKTGTTNSKKDRYFCGYTGYYTAAVWCGFEIPAEIQLVDSNSHPGAILWHKVMEPIHDGLENIPMYDKDAMVSVTICLESGELAGDACKSDVRGLERTREVLVYPEDAPTEYCSTHVMLKYCDEGKAAANEYCKKFADVGVIKLSKKGFVKMTFERIEQIRMASECGLRTKYVKDSYIYQVDEYGNPEAFKGIFGDLNETGACVTCKVHTADSWSKYQRQHGGSSVEQYPAEPETPEDASGNQGE